MRTDLYLPITLNNLPNLDDIIYDPLFYMDIVILKWFQESIAPFFKDINITTKLFVGEKAFNPIIEKPPIFVVYNSTGIAFDDDIWLSGIISILPHKVSMSKRDNTSVEEGYSEIFGVTSTYNFDGLLDTQQRINMFNLWYLDLFSNYGLQRKILPGIKVLNQYKNTYENVPFYIYPSSFNKGINAEGYDKGDVIYTPTASLIIKFPIFKNIKDFPETKKFIIDFFVSNLSNTKLWLYDPIKNSYVESLYDVSRIF